MRMGNVIIAYFVIGAVMFGGGAVSFQESGVATFFIEQSPGGQGQPAEGENAPAGLLEGVGNAITQIAELLSGGLIFVWNLIVGLIAFMHWPLVLFLSHHVPFQVTVLLGGTPTAMFYMATIRLVRTSA